MKTDVRGGILCARSPGSMMVAAGSRVIWQVLRGTLRETRRCMKSAMVVRHPAVAEVSSNQWVTDFPYKAKIEAIQ